MQQIHKLLDFINKNENWQELIQKEPYCINIKEENNYKLLKYNQLESDFNNKIVCSCRGIILNQNNEIVCFPFYKFFNYGELQAYKIDWSSAKVQQKIDGSLIKLWYDDKWHISTNNCINAFSAFIEDSNKSFGDIFKEASKNLDYNKLNKDNTYMFELVSPETKIIVDYKETKIYHIGTRNNKTFKEIDDNIGIEKPKLYKFNTLEDLIENAKHLTKNEEGYVVVDKNYNRIKVKSPAYLLAHYILGNGKFTNKRIIDIIKSGEENEILNYFPEYKINFDKINEKINLTVAIIYNYYSSILYEKDRYSYLKLIKEKEVDKYFTFLMKMFDNPNINIKLELLKLPTKKILEVIQ